MSQDTASAPATDTAMRAGGSLAVAIAAPPVQDHDQPKRGENRRDCAHVRAERPGDERREAEKRHDAADDRVSRKPRRPRRRARPTDRTDSSGWHCRARRMRWAPADRTARPARPRGDWPRRARASDTAARPRRHPQSRRRLESLATWSVTSQVHGHANTYRPMAYGIWTPPTNGCVKNAGRG